MIKIVTDLLQKNASLLSAMSIFCMIKAVINRCFHITCIQFFTVHLYLNQKQFEPLSLDCVILGNIFWMSTANVISAVRYVFLQTVSFFRHRDYLGNMLS